MILFAALLLAADAPQPTAAAVQAAPPVARADKVRCKREVRTGSLASVSKVCHTQREWDDIARLAREEYGKLQGAGHTNDKMAIGQ